ncbi:hypothetical protein N7468_005613 [Penicillium chermesinum]|uniref:Meiotically up-regulated gene 154 protein n=1 Tax=Penicillium chermesinum TaxID=63820 RepID=A0A9W9TND1_9EURO|nr:uncharacterized protein N7468_005613 [Penicillium chermesinum]KAJ5232657.1 hypothetical protein N7468_005613 [Penicillium chermesinum]KAJ6172315.1 hypothetical protein N7470_001382 [Penicillium chermesinum]
MPRLVRRRPLGERIRSYLNPWDFLLWLSEEIEGNDWDQLEKDWGLVIGIALNLIFLVARANSRSSGSQAIDDVFGEEEGIPWLSWLALLIVHTLAFASVGNALYTFFRKRRYRLFENPIEKTPATPSAHRVRVDSSPMTSSPFRYLANALSSESAQSRAHPDAHRDVWEIAIWDPLPICVRLFCLLSPGHVLVYWLFLPTQLSDPRPSVTIATTVILEVLLSVQMSFISSSYSQQAKDSVLVQKEVMKEYDTKYVHPRTQPLMRDVGTQFSEGDPTKEKDAQNRVEVYTPTFIINRGFKTSPNPNYLSHVDPDGFTPRRPTSSAHPISTPQPQPSLHTPSQDVSPLVRTAGTSMRQPQFRPTTTGTGDGGSLGVYTHANSPLRKSASTGFDRRVQSNGDFFYKERATSPLKRPSSPLKRSSLATPMSPSQGPHRPVNLGSRRETGRY